MTQHAATHRATRPLTPAGSGNPLSEFFRYHGMWAPGVRLFRAVDFRIKAAIIAITFVIPIAVLAWQYLSDKADAIGFSAKERSAWALSTCGK